MPRPQKVTDAAALLSTEQTRARAKIQVGNIIASVQEIQNDKFSDPQRAAVRLNAAKLLLAKALPDLSSVEHKGSVDGSITITINKLA